MDQSTHGKMSHTTTPLCLNPPTSSFNQNVANINVVKAKPISFSICDSRKIHVSEKLSQESNSIKMIKQ